MENFEQSKLWKNQLAPQSGEDTYAKGREILRNSFLQTRDAIKPLVAQIGNELPDLTVHDITHLDSLWNVADVLIGDNFEINPAETFVLGMTFLLHDAACSTYAYPNGVNDLKNTTEWNDFVVQNNLSDIEMAEGQSGYKRALFETLRLLHPKQAEKLLTQSWPSLDGQNRFLMENVELRNYYGQNIGLIAASHGKDAAIAEQRWANSNSLTPPSCLQLDSSADWCIDCLKIAMLLRCIDAAHIDNKRAPDMLASISPPNDESRSHWIYQSRLGNVSINDKKELYWTSGKSFEEHDSDAWWLCYDTMKMIDREIRISNHILKNNSRKELLVKGVVGAQDISLHVKNVQVQGWHPVDLKFQIRDVSGVIEKFGGDKLYGQKPYLALRELIQNAADAIRARRLHRDRPELGCIDISLTQDNNKWWLHVQDNGIGMSRYVLTDILLDFGRSLWRDSNIREQWAGLTSKGFESVGQFGIGFFSVFMLGDEIKVTSWRDGDAEDHQATLHLRKNTKSRPILLNTPADQRLKECGTRVSICLKNGRSTLLIQIPEKESTNLFSPDNIMQEMTLAQMIGALAPALDIDVQCQDGEESTKSKIIEANDWKTITPLELLRRIAPVYSDKNLEHGIEHFHNLTENGEIVGRASLAASNAGGFGFDIGVLVHKGMTTGRWGKCGVLISSNNEDLARNVARPICSENVLKSWAEQIIKQMHGKVYLPLSNIFLSLGLTADNLPIAEYRNKYVTGAQFNDLLMQEELNEIIFMLDPPICPDSMSNDDFGHHFELSPQIINLTYNRFFRREEFGLKDWIYSLVPETEEMPRSIASALHYYIIKQWPASTNSSQECVVGTANGEEIKAKCSVYQRN